MVELLDKYEPLILLIVVVAFLVAAFATAGIVGLMLAMAGIAIGVVAALDSL